MNTSAQESVFIVDDDDDFRESVKWLLESSDYPVEAFASAREFLEEYDGRQGCMLLDVRMPEINGLALQQIMKDREILLPIIVISGHGDVPMAVNAMKNGAVDFIEKPFDEQQMLRLINKGLQEAEKRFQQLRQQRQVQARYDSLSQRECEVMQLVVNGKANREIADILGISPKTVEVHRSRVMSKMRADNLAQLVRMSAEIKAPE
ncbi:response regulator transcription factor [Nitrincola alkalilacustris]|uniref:response regulator transcription factor n=1 Tax=Nitrincola alkalilacustris TaxID=1571224 RepID=UPI00124D052A|nr:response regulator [Nitrincola alkalilacustris]